MKEKLVEFISKVSIIFTAMIILSLCNGKETVSHRTILGSLGIAILLVLTGKIVYSEKNISRRQYCMRVLINFILCFVIYLVTASLIGINDMTKWTVLTWSIVVFLYISVYVFTWWFITARHKHDVEQLNIKLNKLKQ